MFLHISLKNKTALAEDFYNMGSKNINNIYFSYVIIKEMMNRYSSYAKVDFNIKITKIGMLFNHDILVEVMDATDLKYEKESLIILLIKQLSIALCILKKA